MTQPDKNFHEIALKSMLFKGHVEWYFCYLKSEKIAHVLALLATRTSIKDSEKLEELVEIAARLPHTVVQFIAGETEVSVVLADIFTLLSMVRLSSSRGYIHADNTSVIVKEYENLVGKITAQSHPSPFVSSHDFSVDDIPVLQESRRFLSSEFEGNNAKEVVKDIDKGHKSQSKKSKGLEQESGGRMSLILDFVRKNKEVSIKDIAGAVRDCSEKTIQRELGQLIQKGLIERRGERRWSVYIAVPNKD